MTHNRDLGPRRLGDPTYEAPDPMTQSPATKAAEAIDALNRREIGHASGLVGLPSVEEIATEISKHFPTAQPMAGEDVREGLERGVEAAAALVDERGSYGDEHLAQRIRDLKYDRLTPPTTDQGNGNG